MQAHDRFLPGWFSLIRSRRITLPRFQRSEAWGFRQVERLLTTVLRGLPSGAALILQVGNEEKFKSRTMIDAPVTGEKVAEQLLDGQQRLTALWRSLNGNYLDRNFLVCFKEEDDPEGGRKIQPCVYSVARRPGKDGGRLPQWVDNPRDCWSKGYIPFTLLRPEDMEDEIDRWVEDAIPVGVTDKHEAYKALKNRINELRIKVREFNLPYLALPPETSKRVALGVFVDMNTSAVDLKVYDIMVALVEGKTGESLHDHVEALSKSVPRAELYADIEDLVLDVAALRQDKVPSDSGYRKIDHGRMLAEWNTLVEGIKGMVRFLESESVFDKQRLPSYTAIPVLAALWEHRPTQPDQLGNATLLMRKYLWRAFLTFRYGESSASNALQDYKGLRRVLCEGAPEDVVPVLNGDSYPLPTKDMVLRAGWPNRRIILDRGLLGLQLKCGADDFADGERATVATIISKVHPREYHHLFPAATLRDAGIPEEQICRALNCVLITWRTNRTISAKDPIIYLKERADNSCLGEEEIMRRLRTHLVPYAQLAVGYDGMSDDERRGRVKNDYETFLSARADVLVRAAQAVCEGKTLEMRDLLNDAD